MYGSGSGNAKLRLRPQNQMYSNSYVGGSGDISTIDDVYDIYDDINKLNIYVNHIVNTTPIINEVFRSNPIINNRFYFFAGHGSNGSIKYAPQTGAWVGATDLATMGSTPTMADVQLAVWAACHSAQGNNSITQEAITQGADFSLGWVGSIDDTCASTYTWFLWENIGNGFGIEESVASAVIQLRDLYWFIEVVGWGDNDIVNPVLLTSLPVTTAKIDVSMKIKEDSSIRLFPEDMFLENQDEYYKYVVSTNEIKYIKLIDNIMTNDFYVIKSSENEKGYIIEHTKKQYNSNDRNSLPKSIEENTNMMNYYYLIIDGQINLVERRQILSNSSYPQIKEVFYNITQSKYMSLEEITAAFSA